MAQTGSEWNVRDFGAVGDGAADCTAAFAQAMAAAAAAGGGTVIAPAGRYRFDGVLDMPKQVTLRGTYAYAPAHAGIRDKSDELPVSGTVLEPYAGAGSEEGAPFITLNTNAVLQGVTVHYPAQKPDAAAPTPYPFAVAMRGNNPAVIDVQLLNPYKGIDASRNQRALVRNVHGQPIRLGLFVDVVYDIGRIENVHWNPWWTLGTPVYEWQTRNGEGFVFARTDWHYVLNTFCFGYHVGYRFTESKDGATNGNFLGIGADDCHTAVLVDETAPMGVLIANGEFVSFRGADPTMVKVAPTHGGTVRFNNCAFWGPGNRIAVVEGWGVAGFSDCSFMQWGHNVGSVTPPEGGFPALDLRSGTVLVRGCDFMEDKRQIALGPDIERAVITDNVINGRTRIDNGAKGRTVVRHNVDSPRGKHWNAKLEDIKGFRAQERRESLERAEAAKGRRTPKPLPKPGAAE